MSNPRFSLCVSSPKINDPTKILLFRIADFYDDCLIQAEYSNPYDEDNKDYQPRIIGYRPNDVVLNRAEIRKWWPLAEDKRKSLSEATTLSFYEVVFPNEFRNVNIHDEPTINTVLKDGLNIDNALSEQLLIVIGEDNDFYIALECKKSDFKVRGNQYFIDPDCSDMHHTKHFLYKHYIHKEDIIFTESLNINYRYFYKYTVLDKSNEKFYIRTFEDYLPVFINKYIKQQNAKKDFTSKQLKNMVSIVREALNHNESLEAFFALAGYSSLQQIQELLPKYVHQIEQYFLSNDKATQLIENYILNSEEVYKWQLDIVKNIWLSEKDEERVQIETEIEEKTKEVKKLTSSINEAQLIEQQLEEKSKLLKDEIDNLVKTKEQITGHILVELEDFEKNLVKSIAMNSIYRSIGQTSSVSKTVCEQQFIMKQGKAFKTEYEVEMITKPNNFISDLTENLQIVGIHTDYAYEFAQIIYGAISLNMGFVSVGPYTQSVVDAVAALVCGRKCDVITLPVGFTNLPALVECVNNTPSRIVLIENALDNMTETLCISLIKQCLGKILFFSVENVDEIALFQKSIWNYLVLVDVDAMMDYPCNTEMIITKIKEDLFGKEIKKENLPLKKIRDLTAISNLSNSTNIKLSELIGVINEGSSQLNLLVLLEILYLTEKSKEADFLVATEPYLSDKQRQIINKFLPKDQNYE